MLLLNGQRGVVAVYDFVADGDFVGVCDFVAVCDFVISKSDLCA
jgi:hypothetical protein